MSQSDEVSKVPKTLAERMRERLYQHASLTVVAWVADVVVEQIEVALAKKDLTPRELEALMAECAPWREDVVKGVESHASTSDRVGFAEADESVQALLVTLEKLRERTEEAKRKELRGALLRRIAPARRRLYQVPGLPDGDPEAN